jgi:hypothetical protein
MPKYLAFLLSLVLVLTPVKAQGQSPIRDIPPGDDRIVPLRQGEAAPYTGQLYSPETALRWAGWLQQYKLRLEVDVTAERMLREADVALGKRLVEIEQEKYRAAVTTYTGQLVTQQVRIKELEREIANPPWYHTPFFYLVMGTVGASLVVGVVALAK